MTKISNVNEGIPVEKFTDPKITAKGKKRAWVNPQKLETVWFNTGTLCNIECLNCYIESSPRNDKLVYITHAEVMTYLDEIERENLGTREIGLTGGEPFMNPDIIAIIETCLERGFELIVLTNAMRPMMCFQKKLLALSLKYNKLLTMRISIDHYTKKLHEDERRHADGKVGGTWEPMLKGLRWLSDKGFNIDAAGRTRWGESVDDLRAGYKTLFAENNIAIDADNPKKLVLFPEMETGKPTPEITTDCWGILNVNPDDMMCANSRMIVKRKGANKPEVMPCTLLFEDGFGLGQTLADSNKPVPLNSPKCSKFCVLGGGSCSAKK